VWLHRLAGYGETSPRKLPRISRRSDNMFERARCTMRPVPCPGAHNDAWRAAETLRLETGQPHELNPGYGDVRWCTTCIERTHGRLAELPKLFSLLHLEFENATVPKNLLTGGRGGTGEPLLHPNQRFIVLADEIYDRVTEWAQTVRQDRGLAQPKASTRRGYALQRDAKALDAHLTWLLDEHPAQEAGRAMVDDIHRVWRRARAATGEAPVRPVDRDGVPCPNPKCGLAALHSEVVDGKATGYIACRACSNLYTEAELAEWIERKAGTVLVDGIARVGQGAADAAASLAPVSDAVGRMGEAAKRLRAACVDAHAAKAAAGFQAAVSELATSPGVEAADVEQVAEQLQQMRFQQGAYTLQQCRDEVLGQGGDDAAVSA
jgi:hypothetical protein